MRVTPISEEQAAESFEPWPSGEYEFIVNEAEEGFAKSSGAEQIKLTLHVFNKSGGKKVVFDYLPSAAAAQWKVRQFAAAVGMLSQYESGDLDPFLMLGKHGKCQLRFRAAEGGYAAQNAVASYVVPKQATALSPRSKAKVHTGGELDDEIPF
jgi:Protein of unknown function (DUF669)